MAPTRKDQESARPSPAQRRPLPTRPLTEVASLADLFENSLPSFGGGYLRRLWVLLDEAIGRGLPLTLSMTSSTISVAGGLPSMVWSWEEFVATSRPGFGQGGGHDSFPSGTRALQHWRVFRPPGPRLAPISFQEEVEVLGLLGVQ